VASPLKAFNCNPAAPNFAVKVKTVHSSSLNTQGLNQQFIVLSTKILSLVKTQRRVVLEPCSSLMCICWYFYYLFATSDTYNNQNRSSRTYHLFP